MSSLQLNPLINAKIIIQLCILTFQTLPFFFFSSVIVLLQIKE